MLRLKACVRTAAVILAADVALAMSSGNYENPALVIDDGGGPAASGNYKTRISIGKAVVGLATSGNYRNTVGHVIPLPGAGDVTAPGPVTGFAAAATGDAQIDLSWTNPLDPDFAGVAVFRREGAAPTFTPVRGTSYTVGNAYGDSVCVHAGAGESATDSGLSPSTQYYYAAYAFDDVPNYSTASSADATTLASTPPTVEATLPVEGAKDVEPTTVIAVAFSEPMDQTAAQGAFQITGGVTGTVSWAGNTMTFTPDALLAAETTYTVTIDTSATDAGGTALAADHSFSFTIRAKSGGLYGGCAGTGGPVGAAGAMLAYAVLVLVTLRRLVVRRDES